MAQLTEDMKEFIKNNLAWVATVNQDGIPDLGPKMSMFVLDDNHLAYHERTAGQTYRNLENGSPLVVAFANFEQKKATASVVKWCCTLTTPFTTNRSSSPTNVAPRFPPASRCWRSARSRTSPQVQRPAR